jgi:hypothetical protein
MTGQTIVQVSMASRVSLNTPSVAFIYDLGLRSVILERVQQASLYAACCWEVANSLMMYIINFKTRLTLAKAVIEEAAIILLNMVRAKFFGILVILDSSWSWSGFVGFEQDYSPSPGKHHDISVNAREVLTSPRVSVSARPVLTSEVTFSFSYINFFETNQAFVSPWSMTRERNDFLFQFGLDDSSQSIPPLPSFSALPSPTPNT